MSRLYIIGIIILLILIGMVATAYTIYSLTNRRDYTARYRDDLLKLYDHISKTGKMDDELYYKLMQDVNKIQLELGKDGIASVYQDRLAGIQINNYPLFLNLFNDLRSEMMDYSLFAERIYLAIGSCDEALVKHLGNLNEAIQLAKKRFFNPFYCFSKGINCIISFPIKILEWAGIINGAASGRVLNSRVYDVFSKIVVLLGLIASIMTIILGWDQVVNIII